MSFGPALGFECMSFGSMRNSLEPVQSAIGLLCAPIKESYTRMAFYQNDRVFHSSLRPPAREAHDGQSCAITRGSVPNDSLLHDRRRQIHVRSVLLATTHEAD